MRDRIELVEKNHPKLSMRKQCELLGVARSTVDYQAVPEDPEDIRIKRLLDEIYMIDPCLGSRRLVTVLKRDHGVKINRKRLQRLRREIGHEAIWCKPRTSIPDHGHRKYPYLLRDLSGRTARPGLVHRHHLRADARRARLPVRGDGLVFAQGAGLGGFQHHGNRPLPGSSGATRWPPPAGFRKSSTPTKAASSPPPNGPAGCWISA